jgi:hypothetical protein
MKIIRLNALNMEVPVADRIRYTDIGYVEDINTTYNLLRLGHSHGEQHKSMPKDAIGGMWIFDNPSSGNCFVYIFYLKNPDGRIEIMTRAHEETHALDYMGALPHLNDRLRENGFNLDLFDYDRETRACIGGWYSFVAWGQELPHHPAVGGVDMAAFHILSRSRKRL